MISIIKNHSSAFIAICITGIILIVALYFFFFFNRTAIHYKSTTELAKLLRADFSDVEITAIQCTNSKDGIVDICTRVIIFLREADEWESKGYYSNSEGWFDSYPEHMLPAEIAELKTIGVEQEIIQNRGVNFNQIKVGFSTSEFGIYWYHIDDSYDGLSNVMLLVRIPRKIVIEIDGIVQL